MTTGFRDFPVELKKGVCGAAPAAYGAQSLRHFCLDPNHAGALFYVR